MVFQPIRRTAPTVTGLTGGLLPHLFTLIPTNRDGYFLLRYCASRHLPVRKDGALRCPDFPLLRFHEAAVEQPAASAKVVNYYFLFCRINTRVAPNPYSRNEAS